MGVAVISLPYTVVVPTMMVFSACTDMVNTPACMGVITNVAWCFWGKIMMLLLMMRASLFAAISTRMVLSELPV